MIRAVFTAIHRQEMQRTYHLFPEGMLTLPNAAMQRLVKIGHLRKFADGQFIMHRGDKASGFWIIASGQVMVGRFAEDGGWLSIGVAGPGDVFGELAYFADLPRQGDAIADGAAELYWIDAGKCRQMLEGDVDLALLLMRSLASQVALALDRIVEFAGSSATRRMARLLSNICADDGSVSSTQQQLADHLGVSRVTAVQVLGQLRDAGLIRTAYRRISITDRAALLRWLDSP